MVGYDLLDRLTQTGVLEETDGTVSVSDGFRSEVQSAVADLEESADLAAAVADRLSDDEAAEGLLAVADDDPEFLGRCLALASSLGTADVEALVRCAGAIGLAREPDRTDKTPESFVSVRGDELPHLTKAFRYVVVYLWRDDCQPCDELTAVFDEVFPRDGDLDLLLLSVYGPNWAPTLDREFDAVAAPTTLFLIDGAVNSRLHGAHPAPVIESEVETLKQYA